MSRNSGKEKTPVVIRSNYSRKGGSKFSGGPRDGRKNTSRGWTAYGKGYVKGVFHTEKGRRVIAVAGSGTRHTTNNTVRRMGRRGRGSYKQCESAKER